MHFRRLNGLDWSPSALGFGILRLPRNNDDPSDINNEKALRMVRYAIDKGLNYFDTAWPYHGEGAEPFLGKALQDGYRDRVKIATKLTLRYAEKEPSLDKFLDKQLERLQTDHIDFYLIHGLNKERWQKCKELNVLSWLEKVKKEGKIDHIGFSFHDDFKTFKRIVDSYPWSFCQIQYNYLDENYQAGRKGLKYAASKGLGVIIMEPLRGGQLAAEPPPQIKEIWDFADVDWSPVGWALRWLWNQPEVSIVLSGMSTLEQVEENLKIADQAEIGCISEKQVKLVERAGEIYRNLQPVNCTGCSYCVPCPHGVYIPNNFNFYNQAEIYDSYEENKPRYDNLPEEMKASSCKECGKCLEVCPQNIDIPNTLKEVANYFED